jgi:hypothetical protein
VVFDCTDHERLASFWCEVLAWHEIGRDVDGAIEIGPEGERQFTLRFQPVAEPKITKNRLHIDLNPLDSDQRSELERLEALGARRIDIGQGEQTWFVLADPEGNEFCLLRTPVTS